MIKYCCTLLAAASLLAAAAEPKISRVDDHLYRGRQPRRDDFPALKKMGIRTVLDLRGGPIHKPREQKEVEGAGMHYISIRLSGIFAPSYDQMNRILAVLQDLSRAPVFVHCRRGDDRVGMVIACYRIVHDHWTNEQALAEAREHGISRFEVLMREYVRHFNPSRIETSGDN
jgi:protein tyrosine/serine phosphatase